MRVVIWASLVGTAFWNSFGTFHHEGPTGFIFFIFSLVVADIASRLTLDGILAAGVVGAAIKDSKTSTTL